MPEDLCHWQRRARGESMLLGLALVGSTVHVATAATAATPSEKTLHGMRCVTGRDFAAGSRHLT